MGSKSLKDSCESPIAYYKNGALSLQCLNTITASVVGTSREQKHTEYHLQLENHPAARKFVTRRYSAFLQLQDLVRSQLQQTRCCGGECLLSPFLANVFLQGPKLSKQWNPLQSKNSNVLVHRRIYRLNVFLEELGQSLAKCPDQVLKRCDAKGCRVGRLILSFYGGVEKMDPTAAYSFSTPTTSSFPSIGE